MKTKLIPVMVLLLGLSVGASAQYTRSKDDLSKDRMADARRDGDFKRGDAFHLSRDGHAFNRDGKHFRHHDRKLSKREKRHMRHEKRHHGRHGHRMKHDHHRRFS